MALLSADNKWDVRSRARHPGTRHVTQHRQQADDKIIHCRLLRWHRIHRQVHVAHKFIVCVIFHVVRIQSGEDLIRDGWLWEGVYTKKSGSVLKLDPDVVCMEVINPPVVARLGQTQGLIFCRKHEVCDVTCDTLWMRFKLQAPVLRASKKSLKQRNSYGFAHLRRLSL